MERETNNLVLHGPKVVLMTACKAGNTSIKTALHQAGLATHPDGVYFGFEHWTAEEVAIRADYRRVAVLRHPAARLVSTWWHKVQQNGKADLIERHAIPKGTPWPEFIARVSEIDDWGADQHIRSQCFDRFWRGRYLPEFTIKIEAPDWWTNLRRFVPQLPQGMPRENVSGAPDWREHCSTDDLRRIAIRYHADLWLGGYPL